MTKQQIFSSYKTCHSFSDLSLFLEHHQLTYHFTAIIQVNLC